MDKFDLEEIKNITKEKIAISNFQYNSDMKKNNKLLHMSRRLVSISACIVLLCGIIFSKEISTHIYNYAINFNSEKTTVNNGSTAKFSGEYSISDEEIIDLGNNNEGISQDNLKIKVEDITMDDNNLEVKFNVELSEEILSKLNGKKGIKIEFEDLLITDEEKNVLVGLNEDSVIGLLNIDYKTEYQKHLDWEYESIKKNSIKENEKYFGGNIHSYTLKYDKKRARVVYSMNLVGESKYYPRCKNLNFEIEKIKILGNSGTGYDETILNYQGRWNISVELPENIVNRKMISYKMENSEKLEENKIIFFNTLESGTEIKLSLKAPEVVESDTSPQLKLITALELENPSRQIQDYFVDELMASNEYMKYEDDLRKRYMIQDAYIEDENGNQYRGKNGAYSNFGGKITEDGFYEPTILLEYTEKQVKDKLKLYVTYFDFEFVFDLVKEGEI